jgi:hypothetical protein
LNLGHTGARVRKNERKLILSTDATMSYGFKAQIRTMAMRIRRWRDNRASEVVRWWLNNASNKGTNFWWFSTDQVGSKMKERSGSQKVYWYVNGQGVLEASFDLQRH